MLEVTLFRLRQRWPDAQINVFTKNAKAIQECYAFASPIDVTNGFRFPWLTAIPLRIYPSVSKAKLWRAVSALEWQMHQFFPGATDSAFRANLEKKLLANISTTVQLKTIIEAELVVACGGGYITDTFPNKATRTLAILNMSAWLNKPSVLVGQGLGPITCPALKAQASAVLPRMSLIALRESKASGPLLKSLGVSEQRYITTGDDAIELAYQARSPNVGHAVGVNLRVARYAEIDEEIIQAVRSAVYEFAKQKGTRLLPVPISHGVKENDPEAIRSLLKGFVENCDGGKGLDTPEKVIKQIGLCRVVVTGSYHAGVFALSQGIPIVALAKSQYYQDKFLGLAAQFGSGCEVIVLEDDQLKNNLHLALDRAWNSIEKTRPILLELAKGQIAQGRDAYQRVYEIQNQYLQLPSPKGGDGIMAKFSRAAKNG
jgi:colanic acid/amylovoran biosynthesis protein